MTLGEDLQERPFTASFIQAALCLISLITAIVILLLPFLLKNFRACCIAHPTVRFVCPVSGSTCQLVVVIHTLA